MIFFVRKHPMKSLKSTLMLFLCGALLLSCMPSNEEVNPFTGTWTLKGISCQNCIDKTQITSTTYACNDTSCNTYSFNEDGTVKLVELLNGSTTIKQGSYSVSGPTLRLRLSGETSVDKVYSFSLNGSMLYLKEIVDENVGQCGSTTVLSK